MFQGEARREQTIANSKRSTIILSTTSHLYKLICRAPTTGSHHALVISKASAMSEQETRRPSGPSTITNLARWHWTQYTSALESLVHGNTKAGIDLLLELVVDPQLPWALRALVNLSLARETDLRRYPVSVKRAWIARAEQVIALVERDGKQATIDHLKAQRQATIDIVDEQEREGIPARSQDETTTTSNVLIEFGEDGEASVVPVTLQDADDRPDAPDKTEQKGRVEDEAEENSEGGR
jgi:hypothetical protein